ncbi:zona pellucida sperm-binding protein 3-like [Leuresthes tenuis]|uniref:zona pellucida sperm-binding protein 3-like n=1 Tax=Leuresthes tenuis TaxID=355514 RepID=UPI003B50F4DF
MKTKWYIFILCISVITLGPFSSAYELPFIRRKRDFKLGASKPKPINLSTTEDRKLSQKFSSSTPPSSKLPMRKLFRSLTAVTPISMRQEQPEEKIQSDIAYDPDVSVTCSTSDFVVRVRRGFYGLGADEHELTIGSSCKSNGNLGPQGDLLFAYPLASCNGVRKLPRGFLIYKYVLHYEPSPKRFPSRAHPIDVVIECHYLRAPKSYRDYPIHQLAVQPTWQTVVVRKKLKRRPMDFEVTLMDVLDYWRAPARTHEYLLGQTVNIQVSALHLPAGEKMYISRCYATPSSGPKSSLKYTIMGNFGCMLDSKQEPGSSEFISRTDETLRFSLKAFQFTADPDTEVGIHCKLLVTLDDSGPAHKSCTYRDHRWRALAGHDSICDCCDSKCVTSKSRRALVEGSASSGPFLVSDPRNTAQDGFLPVSSSAVGSLREDKINENYYTGLNSHDKIWESGAELKHDDDGENKEQQLEESETIFGTMTAPDLQELDHKESASELWNFTAFREDGLGDDYKDILEPSEDQMLYVNQTESEALQNQKDGMTSFKVELKSDSSLGDSVDEEEKTWYFTWR